MSNVSIIYYSNSGTTALLAEAVARGARGVEGTKVATFAISGQDIVEGRWQDEAVLQKLSESDAIIFGTPTYMGGPAAQFKAFADATGGIWYNRGWQNKIAGGFTISGSPSGDKLNTLSYLSLFSAQHGMTWVGSAPLPASGAESAVLNRIGSHLGVMAQNPSRTGGPASLHPGDALTGEAYGRRIAELADRLQAVAA